MVEFTLWSPGVLAEDVFFSRKGCIASLGAREYFQTYAAAAAKSLCSHFNFIINLKKSTVCFFFLIQKDF